MSRSLRRGLFDFHIGEHVGEITFDSKMYVERVWRMGIAELLCMTKDAMGTSYYNTRFGRKNRMLDGDMIGEIVEHCRRREIKVVGYYNVSLDDSLSAEHPDWRQCDAGGNSELLFRYYTALCLNSPYREIVRNQLGELAGTYAISGLWLDITYIFDGRCFCTWCREKFRETFGREMNSEAPPGSEDFRLLREFRLNTRYDYLKEFVEHVRAIRKNEFEMGWNHAGDPGFGHVEADRLASEFFCEFHAPDYRQTGAVGRGNSSDQQSPADRHDQRGLAGRCPGRGVRRAQDAGGESLARGHRRVRTQTGREIELCGYAT